MLGLMMTNFRLLLCDFVYRDDCECISVSFMGQASDKQSDQVSLLQKKHLNWAMNNFHYRGSTPYQNQPQQPPLRTEKSAKLLQQLQQIDRQLEEDNKKLVEKKRLQQEFYEDVNRMNLADQVMNEILGKKPQATVEKGNQGRAPQQYKFNQQPQYNIPVQEIGYTDPRVNVRPGQNISPPGPAKVPEYMLNMNARELQKLKLQNKNAQQEFPFGGNSKEKDRKQRNQYENPTRISPQRQPIRNNNYMLQNPQKPKNQQKSENPFIKNDQILKQQRQQQQKNYRRLLQQQMQQQKRKKESQKQKYKQQLQQKYNNYTPTTNIPTIQSPQNEPRVIENANIFKKKRDPNAQHVPLEKPHTSEIRASDLEFMRLQVQDLKNKFRKGRINYEEYGQQVRKLENHYKFKVEELGLEENEDNQAKIQNRDIDIQPNIQIQPGNNSERIKNSRLQSPAYQQPQTQPQNQSMSNKSKPLSLQHNQHAQPYEPHAYGYNNNTSVPIDSMGQRPQPQQMYQNYSQYYHPAQQNVPNSSGGGGQPDYQMQMMFKLLDQFKNIFKMQTQAVMQDKKVLQDTLTKMIPAVNPIMLTQQVPPNQLPINVQKQFQTEAKREKEREKVERFQNFPKNGVHGVEYSVPGSESEISSSYIEKSMSGIVNKIPLTKKQKEQQSKVEPNKELTKFYQRKYKIKKFKGFEYREADNQSNVVIPSVSNFLQPKNAADQLNQAFQRDLRDYKKLQKDREMQLMIEKIKRNKDGGDSRVEVRKGAKGDAFAEQGTNFFKPEPQAQPEPKSKPASKEQPIPVNPFLKKHVSNQSSHSQSQPQLHTKLQLQVLSSPTPKNQILEQEEYQTEPRKSESPTNANKQPRRNQASTYNPQPPTTAATNPAPKQYPSSKILNTVRTNNEILAKYEMTPPQAQSRNSGHHIGSNSLSSIKEMVRADSSKELSSREYFSGHDISPVQRREYESSLETVRSQEESAKFERKNNLDLLVLRSPGLSSNFESQYQSANTHSIHASPTIESIQFERRQQAVGSNMPQINPNMGYSQTVESIQESSNKVPSFQKPPNNNSKKGGRSVSRKKESVIKVGNSDNFQRSGLSGIPSEGSREKSSENRNLSAGEENLSAMEAPKFDSAVYQSGYQQSISLNYKGNVKQGSPQEIDKEKQYKNQYQDSRYLAPSSFREVMERESPRAPTYSKQYNFSQKGQVQQNNSSNLKPNTQEESQIKPQQQPLQPQPQPQPQASILKFKSLDTARKIARQFRHRAGQDHNRSSVQQKLSQLESMIQISRKDDSILRREDSILRKEDSQGTTNKKKDIMKILDNLDEQDYEPDFESYKEESQR